MTELAHLDAQRVLTAAQFELDRRLPTPIDQQLDQQGPYRRSRA